MPIYEPDHVEYNISSGYVHIVLDGGHQLPAYFAHPIVGSKFPGVGFIHDWWGLTDMTRRLANLFAQMGHYVITPDLFNEELAATPREALKLVESLEENGYPIVNSALEVLEDHHQCNGSVAAVGVGMGGSLAFEAAIRRDDLEAVVAYAGFPHRCFGSFHESNTPIYALYGEDEPHIKRSVIKRLEDELSTTPRKIDHRVEIVPGLGHEFFSDSLTQPQRYRSRSVLRDTFAFLDIHLERPIRPRDRFVY